MVGYVVQVSRAQTRIAEENVRLLAEQQEVRTQMAVREEKERLTRELHDIVAHGVGVMVALASAGRVEAEGRADRRDDPDQVLTAIEGTGRAALKEMRSLMRDLHGDVGDAAPMLSRRRARGTSSTGPGRPAWRSTWRSRATRGRCRRASTRPPSGSCRSRSPTCCATRERATCTSASATAPTPSTSGCGTTGAARCRGGGPRTRRPATVTRGCSVASTSSAGCSTPADAGGVRGRRHHPARSRAVSGIRVLLVDDQSLMRQALRSCLEAAPDLEVVGEAGTARRPWR